MSTKKEADAVVASIVESLREQGCDVSGLGCGDGGVAAVKVVCVPGSLRGSLEALGESSRDQVVMVRVDGETVRKLDAWVETGAVKSRSEAAALFMREGLAVRDAELGELEESLSEVAAAKRRLQDRAREVLGAD